MLRVVRNFKKYWRRNLSGLRIMVGDFELHGFALDITRGSIICRSPLITRTRFVGEGAANRNVKWFLVSAEMVRVLC